MAPYAKDLLIGIWLSRTKTHYDEEFRIALEKKTLSASTTTQIFYDKNGEALKWVCTKSLRTCPRRELLENSMKLLWKIRSKTIKASPFIAKALRKYIYGNSLIFTRLWVMQECIEISKLHHKFFLPLFLFLF